DRVGGAGALAHDLEPVVAPVEHDAGHDVGARAVDGGRQILECATGGQGDLRLLAGDRHRERLVAVAERGGARRQGIGVGALRLGEVLHLEPIGAGNGTSTARHARDLLVADAAFVGEELTSRVEVLRRSAQRRHRRREPIDDADLALIVGVLLLEPRDRDALDADQRIDDRFRIEPGREPGKGNTSHGNGSSAGHRPPADRLERPRDRGAPVEGEEPTKWPAAAHGRPPREFFPECRVWVPYNRESASDGPWLAWASIATPDWTRIWFLVISAVSAAKSTSKIRELAA